MEDGEWDSLPPASRIDWTAANTKGKSLWSTAVSMHTVDYKIDQEGAGQRKAAPGANTIRWLKTALIQRGGNNEELTREGDAVVSAAGGWGRPVRQDVGGGQQARPDRGYSPSRKGKGRGKSKGKGKR